ncbi:MAG: amidohydrolase 2 [Frankiales bacterium]|nr:amidohydrolase 2 [Frankiales bacterium]
MLFDALIVAGGNLFAPSQSLADVLAVARSYGVDAVVAAPGRPPEYALGPANDALAAEAEGLPEVVRLGRVDPLQGAQAVAEARRCLGTLGCAGLFLHPGEEYFPMRAARDVLRVAAEVGAPVVVAAGLYGLSEPLQILSAAQEVPDAPIVMTSGGQINISGLSMIDAWAALSRSRNLHVMTNGVYRQDFIEKLASELPGRVLFGSFSPYFEQGFEVTRIRCARMSAAARREVESAGALRLFGSGLDRQQAGPWTTE